MWRSAPARVCAAAPEEQPSNFYGGAELLRQKEWKIGIPGTDPRRRFGVPVYLTTAYLARFADEGMPTAVALLAVHRTGSPAQGAYLLTAWMAPHALTAPLTGSLAGRVRRPRLFYSGALAAFAASIVVLALTLGRTPFAVTLAVALAGGSCGPIVTGGLSGLLSGLLTEGAARQRGYALDAATFNAAAVTGAAAVTLVAGVATPVSAVVLLGGGAALAALLVSFLLYPSPTRSTGRPSLVADLGAGVSAVWQVVELRAITVASVIAFGGLGGLAMTAVLLMDGPGAAAGGGGVTAGPGEGDVGGGFLMTAFALGGLLGSLAVARWQPFATVQRMAFYALLGTGATLAAAALVPSLPVRVALFALAGFADGPLLGATLRLRAEYAPPAVLPQVFTIGAGLKMSAGACGAALTGTAVALGAPRLLLAIAGLHFVAALLYVLVRGRGSRTAERSAGSRSSGVRGGT